jgi:hypothetical protein
VELAEEMAMENLIVALNAVLPMFLMIGVGCLARHWHMISDDAVRQANALCFKVFMSLLLFYNVYCSDLKSAFNGRLVAYCMVGILLEFLLGLPLILRIEQSPPARGVMLQAFFRTNFVLLGLPITQTLFGKDSMGEVTLLSAFFVPAINILSVVALEMFRGGKPSPRKIVGGVAGNPLVRGALVGVLFSLLGLRLPGVVESAVSSIAGATTPLALVLLGASLDFSKFKNSIRNAAICVVERLVAAPALFIGIAVLLGFRGVALGGVMIAFAAPVAVASFTMAVQMDGDADLAGQIVLLTTGLSCFTLFGWIFLLKTLGLF